MKTRFLFPHYWRIIGYLCFAVDIVFAIVLKILHPPNGVIPPIHKSPSPGLLLHGITFHNDINILLIVFGLLFIAFSKEEIEDEQIAQLRLDSLQWAIYVNYAIFILCVLFINGIDFLEIVVYNIITPLIIFIIRFRWKIYTLNRLLKNN
jgi:hypothetical protein